MGEVSDSKGKVYEMHKDLVWLRNVPFEVAPKQAIEQLRAKGFSYEDYLKHCRAMDLLQTYWNLSLFDKDGCLVLFTWGLFEPLEQFMQVLRVTLHRSFFHCCGTALSESVVEEYKKLAKDLGAKRIFWISDRYKAFEKKLDGLVYVSGGRVMEVY